ncbi:hypothetical protein D9758_006121 [Tetrapyrgos nigripes]|uniref:Uncharacterized protein n=1 Tax=Tetrapyrgos nigripes TaxID=182062 RepID=A0A8H5LL13_9AGAR|nr:hypothetical protein D9758_006121 [Tetrapyrgos nigripes]
MSIQQNPSIASSHEYPRQSSSNGEYSPRHIHSPPYFPPLSEQDEFDIFEMELQIDLGAKSAEISVRSRHKPLNSGRAIFKAEKKNRTALLGKKNLSLLIFRSDGWDSVNSEPIAQKGKGYYTIFQAVDENPRRLTLTASQRNSVLAGTSKANSITLSPYCGSYDPQKSKTGARDNASFYFFPLGITEFERSASSGAAAPIPSALTKPYSGGGYFVFDAINNGRKDLLCTLYCTGYEKRHSIQKGDIVVAELRLTRPALDLGGGSQDSSAGQPSLWKRLFRERHVSLHVSKRGLHAALVGQHVNMAVPNQDPNSRYTLTVGQAHEIVISMFLAAILSIEHDGLESKKWSWLQVPFERGLTMSADKVSMVSSMDSQPDSSSVISESYDQISQLENMSLADGNHDAPVAPGINPNAAWKVNTFASGNGVQPVAISTEGLHPQNVHHHVPQYTQAHAVYHGQGQETGSGDLTSPTSIRSIHHMQSSDGFANGAATNGLPVQMSRTVAPVPNFVYPVPPPPPHHLKGAELTDGTSDWADVKRLGAADVSIIRKEGPKVTGKPKPGVDGGIFW